ncbi:MAG: hypothetical protein MZU97_13770 [Bacillus subtilis]|nr:hypothetical protein [Bacillus subtilis]
MVPRAIVLGRYAGTFLFARPHPNRDQIPTQAGVIRIECRSHLRIKVVPRVIPSLANVRSPRILLLRTVDHMGFKIRKIEGKYQPCSRKRSASSSPPSPSSPIAILAACTDTASNIYTYVIDASYTEYVVMGTSADYPPYEWPLERRRQDRRSSALTSRSPNTSPPPSARTSSVVNK